MTATAHRPAPTVLDVLAHVLGAALPWAGAVLVGIAALTTTTGQWLDERAFQQAHGAFPDLSAQSRQLLDLLPWAVGVVSAVCLAVLVARSRRITPAVTGAAVVVLSNLTVQLLKRVFVEKPDLGVQEAVGNSFPSGHTAAAAAAVAVVLLAAPARLRPLVALAGACATTATGVATLLNGWHRPSDVVASLLVVAGWAALGGLVLRLTGPVEHPAPGGWLTAALAVAGAGALALGLLPLWAALRIPGGGFAAAAGCAAILGVSLLTAAALAALQAPRSRRPRS
ncbi:phosphatase PAP2 family protein [Kocuria rosea]|jgi:membrane-associated phospholipid phosphatase|uniref:phosphatase PAP2 family protein n=1 Tax=Kocuria rosea TaxID=1275 RepID=UPI00203A3E9E|nr:phosphatase PAP2 family protein [Kocuria rosea]MCM3687662.1 phosphatase PAP2 family protein [Kocuria rosea]